jgi:aminoglycoside phosphotransferase (APT) family kinase protein
MPNFKENKKFQPLLQRIDPQSKLRRAWELRGGISAQMTALEVMRSSGQTQKLIVRRPCARAFQQNPHAALDEFNILQIVQSAGVKAQTPYFLDQSGEIFPEPYLVIEYIEGQPEYAPANLTDCVRQIATQLARIHSVDSSKLNLSFLPQQAEKLANTLKARPATLDHSLDEERIRGRLESVRLLLQVNQPVLLHGDFWPGNLLWKDGQLVAVIDWEDAQVGDPLMDFAISRLDILWIFGQDAMQDFTYHYQQMTPFDFTHLPYWDLCAALRPMSRIAEWASGWAELGRTDITEKSMRAGHKLFITQAFDKLEL